MADNVTIPAQGTGDTTPVVAADDVGGVKYQRFKLSIGADGVANDLDNAHPVPVSDAGGSLTVDGTVAVSGTTAVSAASLPLPTGAATEATLDARTGALTETAPASDTASSGLNGRLQRIAQRITSLSALFPTSLGQKTSAASLAVVVASDQSAVSVSGTVTTTPPSNASTNIAQVAGTTTAVNSGALSAGVQRVTLATDQVQLTNALKVDPSAVTSPVSLASVPSHAVTNAGTFATQDSQKVVDNAAFTDGTTPVQPAGYVFDEVAGTALTENDAAAARINANRAQVSVIEDDTTRGRRTTVTAANALKVDGSAVTQPVSGTVTTTPPSNASTNIAQVAGATVAQGHGTAASALRVELPTDGTGTVVLATGAATIGALTANQSVNQTQVAGTTVDTNSGNKSAGTQRFVLATDQPALTNALKVDGSAVTQPISGTITATGTINTELSTGLTTFSNTALSNTKTAVKASAGKVYGWMVHNPSAATAYIQVWNVAIGSITVGTTAPTYTIPLPAGASANVMSERGITHSTEINVAATTTATGSTAPATALVVSIFYI